MTEKEWLEYLKNYLSLSVHVLATYNEDCAVIQVEPSKFLLLTTDAMIERVHFDLSYFDFYSLGVKLANVNLSDIAAMGGEPKWALLTLGAPYPPSLDWIGPFMEGLTRALKKYGASLVGGDTVKSPQLFLNLSLIGETDKPLLRSSAKPGDLILVSRPLGESSAFLRYLKTQPLEKIPSNLKKAHLTPEPEIELGKKIKELANCAIDVSDGLLIDLYRICLASSVAAVIKEELIPIAQGATIEEALSGGEDYALLFTVEETSWLKLKEKLNSQIYPIGKILEGEPKIFIKKRKGEVEEVPPLGFDHFTFQSQF